jgi:tRNA A-37 threonylcarbamoyl transferase component Bud32
MTVKVKIKRGDALAERLKEQLEAYPEGAAEWMAAHTQILASSDFGLSGLLRIDDQFAYLKLYRFKSFAQKIKLGLGIAQPLRNFNAAGKLRQSGVPVPQPLACLKVGQGVLAMTEGLSGGNLADLWLSQPSEALRIEERAMCATGETLATLHTAGYFYGDCRWGNLFWNGQSSYLTSLENTRRSPPGSKLQAQDLAQFTANAEWLGIGSPLFELFLDGYLQGVTGDRREVVERMMPAMYRLRAQHLSGYGQRLV